MFKKKVRNSDTLMRRHFSGRTSVTMGWLDGMTGCQGDCNTESHVVTFKDFTYW